ncbi:MAG: UDP-N-acetylmuramoyl-tripeptide--D-alanyl-D-alanine ligase [Myxococcaceae bacterium]
MGVRFSDEQVVTATGGRRLREGARGVYDGVSTDTRSLTPGCLFVALRGEKFDAHAFLAQAASAGAAGAVVEKDRTLSGGLPQGFALFEVGDTLAALGALARHHRSGFKIPLGAVGGSNGKTTTKEMVAAILAVRGEALKTEGNFNNEVGVPLTLFRLDTPHVAAVIEMGMNHAGEMTRLAKMGVPDAAVITVVQPEHLEGLGSLEGVAEAEGELFKALPATATAVVNLDDPLIVKQANASTAKQVTFGREAKADLRLVRVEPRGRAGITAHLSLKGRDYPVKLQFIGDHNAQNAAAAFALAWALGYSPEECVRGLEKAKPYARRLNVLDAPNGVTVIDDCYNANPASMNAALDTVQTLAKDGGRAVAVLGDMLELGPGELEEHKQLGERAAGMVKLAAFFGPRSAEGFKAAAKLSKNAAHFTEIEPLTAWLLPQLRQGDVVLVKGSRGMKLERVVAALTGQAAPAAGAH